MGRLTDLLNKRGMIDGLQKEGSDNNEESKSDIVLLSDKFPQKNLTEEIKDFLKEFSNKLSKKKVFEDLPTIGEFYIPHFMNGRVIECSDRSFQTIQEKRVIRGKAYKFDGYEIKYLFFDNADNSIQKGSFEEFPRDGFGNTMGHVGIHNDILCWKTKKSKNV